MSPTTTTLNASVPVQPKLTTKRKILLSSLINGKTMAEATSASGMNRTAGYRAIEHIRERTPDLMRSLGLTEEQIIGRLRDKMDATRTVTASYLGQIMDTIEIADNPIQMQAIELAADLMGMTGKDKHCASIGTVNIIWGSNTPAWAKQLPLPDNSNCNNNDIDIPNPITIDNQVDGGGHEVKLKVLDQTPSGPTHTNSVNAGDLTTPLGGNDKNFPRKNTGNKLTNRIGKRKPRLPRGPRGNCND